MTTYVFGQKKQRVSVVLYEEFTGDGSDVTFQLTSSPANATWLATHGAWAVGNIHTTYPGHVTKTNKKPIYDSIVPLTRHRISVSSISAGGLVTLDYAPRNNVDFYIWYWYQLSTDDILSAYVRPDFIASMEGEMIGALNIYDTDSSNVLSIAWAEDDSSDRILNLLVQGADRSLDLAENLKILDGQDIEFHASGGEKAQLAIDTQNAERTLDLSENLTLANGYDFTLQALGQANSLILNESLTIGDGNDGTITFSAASKTVTVAGSCTLNDWFDQAVKAASNVSFGTIGCGAITSTDTSQMAILGVGLARTEGTIHAHTATCGANITASTRADELVAENSDHGGISILVPNDTQGQLYFGSPGDSVGAIVRWVYDDNLMNIGPARANASLAFCAGNFVEKLRLDSSGNFDIQAHNAVTIGLKLGGTLVTASAAELNQLDGNVFTGNIVIPANGIVGVTDGNPQIVFDNANNWLEITGKVGIGTATPGQELEVAGSILAFEASNTIIASRSNTDAYIDIQADANSDGSNFAALRFYNRGANIFSVTGNASGFAIRDGTPTGNAFFYAEDGADANSLYINSAGNVGIGVTDPDTKLEVLYAGNQLKLSFDGTDNAIFAVDTAGKLTITPSGALLDLAATTDITVHDAATVGLKLGGTLVTASAAEINAIAADGTPTFAGLTLTGGFKANLVTKTANYTATNADYTILCNASGGSFTVTLPTVASHTNRIYNIKKIDSSANTVTVDGNASETIDDSTTAVLTTQYESITIQSDGSEWWII